MEVEVRMPARIGKYVGEEMTVVADGQTLREVITSLSMMFDGLRDELLDDLDQINKNVNIYVNDENVRYLSDLDTSMREGDVITILPADNGEAHQNVR